MRGTGLAAVFSTILVGVAQPVGAPELRSPSAEWPRSTTSQLAGDRCAPCAKYSTVEFRLHAGLLSPWSSNRMYPRIKEKLRSGFQLAIQRLCDIHSCHEMFTRLGADGIDELRLTLYYSATAYSEARTCNRAVAFTRVGVSQTWLCRHFSAYSDNYAATILIHEALHHSGLYEGANPYDQRSSADINQMVIEACGL